MPRLTRLGLIGGLVFPFVAAPLLSAQELTGRLNGASDSAAVAGALVILVDSTGKEIARTLSSPSGGFGVRAAGPGTYRIRVIRIGFASWISPPYALLDETRHDVRLLVADQIIRLADIEVTTTRSRCGVRPGDGDLIAGLLTEAEKALAITSETIRQGSLRFKTETYTNRPSPDGAPGERQLATSVGQAMWPVVSAPPESLAVWGFVHEPGRANEMLSEIELQRGPVYFGPDARVLFSNWFLDTHCFSVVAGNADSVQDVVVEFVPARRPARRDIQGRITLNRKTLELRELTFRYVGLPRWVPVDSAGGRMSFRKLSSGAWVIDRWSLRAPIPRVGRSAADTTLFGYAEAGGRVMEIRYGRNGKVEILSTRTGVQRVIGFGATGEGGDIGTISGEHSPEKKERRGIQVATLSAQGLFTTSLTLSGSDLCAQHGECWVALSSSLSSWPDKLTDRFAR